MPGRTALASLLVCVASLLLAAPALALDIADASPPSGTVGVPYSFTFSLSPGSGSPGAKWSISSGALPPGLRLSSNDRTATVTGTPTQSGSFSFYLKVRDKPGPWVCCTEEQFTISIDPALDITASPELPAGSVGAAYGYQLATSGGTAQAWALTSGTLPPGMTLSPEGALTGTPTQAALAQFTITAADGSRKAAKQFTLKVVEPIVVSAPAATTVKAGRQFLVTFGAKGGLAPYIWSGVDLPLGVGVNAKTGQVGGRARTAGRFTVTLKVTDSLGTTSTATATVSAVEKLAIVTTKLPVAHDGKRFKVTLHTSGGAGPLKVRLAGSKPKWLKLIGGTARLAGTPKLHPRKPLVVVKHTKRGPKRVVKKRPPQTATYNLYLTVVDAIGQRSTQKLKLTVRP